jgi:chaperonin GroES
MKIKPIGDRIVVRRKASDDRSPGGIVIPENAKEKSVQGEVLAVGDGRDVTLSDRWETRPLRVRDGDVVLFGKYAGSEVQLGGELVVILREDDVLGIVEPS